MKKIITICGTGRSGSTMIDLMLGNDPRSFSLGEVYAWFRPYRTHHFEIICSCDTNGDCPWEKLKVLKEKEFYEKAFENIDVDVLVDSSKNLPWVVDTNVWARQNNISCYNVLLYKDPINFFYSYWKRGVSFDRARKKVFMKYYKQFFQTDLPFIGLNYNKIVTKPADTLKELCNLLDIPYFPGKERFWEKEHHQLFGSRGTRKQVEDSTSKIRTTENYPVEYKKIIPQIEADVAKDQEFQKLLSKLKIYELQRPDDTTDKAIHKPHWYYTSKIKQKFLQRFPEKWKYSQ